MNQDLRPANSAGRLRLADGSVALLLALLAASGSAAGQVLIDPVVVAIAPNQRVATVSVALTDKATAPLRLQAQALRWQQDAQGDDVTEPSNDLLVTPVIADIKPGQKQLFRVALRGPRPAASELTYRLILEDVAQPAASASASNPAGMHINFRMRYDLPVLLAPAGPVVERVSWRPCPATAPAAAPAMCIRLRNDGNRHLKIQGVTVSGDGWQQDARAKEAVLVLAGAEREWRMTPQSGHALPVRAVHILTGRGTSVVAEAGHD